MKGYLILKIEVIPIWRFAPRDGINLVPSARKVYARNMADHAIRTKK